MNFNFDIKLNFDFEKKIEKESFCDFCINAGYPKPFKLQETMKEFVFNNSNVRLLLGARGYGKTDYATILGSAEKLMQDPTYKILLITKEQDRGKDIVYEIREILKRKRVKFKNRAKRSIKISGMRGKEPNLAALTIRSRGLRGRHPDLIIMEDPITPEDTSATERRRVKKTYEELCKLTHNIVIIGQPVHKLDLYQELRKLVPTFEMKHGDIPELDADLDAERAAGVDEFSIQASYFLNIMDSESLPLSTVKVVDYDAKDNICWIDPAREGKDYTAVVIGGRNLNDFVLNGFCWRKSWDDCMPEIKYLYDTFKIRHFVLETNGLGQFPVKELQRIGCPCVGYNTTQNKYAKIMNAATFKDDLKLSQLKDMPPEFLQAQKIFIEQFHNFEYNVEHDDAPDAAASLISYIRGL